MTDQATAAATGQPDTVPSGQQTSPPSGTEGQPNAGTPQTGEQQPAGQQGEQPPADPGQQQTEPAEIQDFTMPEGLALDTDLAGELKTFAKENGLTQEKAQQVADLGVKMLQKQQTAFAELTKSWADAARTDKEYGGEAFDANLAGANKAMGQFATPEFLQFLKESGLGNHPEMIRTWYRVSKAVSEDKLVTGSNTAPVGEKTLEQRLYPDMKS